MRVVIDTREKKLHAIYGDGFEVQQFALGDIMLYDTADSAVSSDMQPQVIMERKTVADLAASLVDGRWHEQKLRLKEERARTGAFIVYIIEGGISFNEEESQRRVSNKALISMVMKAMFKDGFQVVFTRNIVDTCDFIKGLARRFPEYGCTAASHAHASQDAHQEALIQAKKRDNVTGATIFAMQLCAVPGISLKKANAIKEHFKVECMAALLEQFKGKDDKESIKLLTGVPGIGKVLATDLYNNMFIGTY